MHKTRINAARAALEAFVDGLSDRRAYNIHPLYSYTGWPFEFDCENNRHGERAAETRDALKAAMEVSDEPNV